MVKKAIICWGGTYGAAWPEQLDQIARFDMALLDFELSLSDIPAIRAKNPNIQILGYHDVVYATATPERQLPEEAYIHDVSTGARLTAKDNPDYLIMNPENQAYRDYIVQKYLPYFNQGFDGAILDDFWAELWVDMLSGTPDPSWNQGDRPTRWQRALQSLLQYLKAQTPDKLWIYNGPSDGLYIPYCDPASQGKMEEGFAFYWLSWRMPIDDINELESISGQNIWDISMPHVYTEALDNEHDFLYAWCCYLLGLQNVDKSSFAWMNFWTVEQGKGPSRGYYPQMDLDYGAPIGDKYNIMDDVWGRAYEKYKIYVNLHHDNLATFTADGQTITLQPRTGLLIPVTPPTLHTLILSASLGGTTNPAPARYDYNEGTSAPITAIPDPNYRFSHWELDGTTRTENPITVLMDRDYSLKAMFEYVPVAITAQASAGGSVSPTGQVQMIIGQTYSFVAIPTPGSNYQFDHWDLGGTNQGSTNPLQLIANASMNGKTLTAVFTTIPPVQITMSIATSGNGSANLANGPHTFNVGDTVTFTASPAPNNTFVQWTLNGTIFTRNPADITITQSMNGLALTAVFRLTAIVLTVQADADGTVNPSGTLLLQVDQAYLFQATPDPGYMLDHWDLSDKSLGSTNPITITATESMDGQTLKPIFTTIPPPQINMNLAVTGSGQTNPAQGAHIFNVGDTIMFTAIPAAGQTFKQWTLDSQAYTDNPLALTITSDMNGKTLTADFTGPTAPIVTPIFPRIRTALSPIAALDAIYKRVDEIRSGKIGG